MQNDISMVYKIQDVSFLPTLHTVDNSFIRQLYKLGVTSAKNNRMLNVVTKDLLANRGEVASKQLKSGDKSVLDLCKLKPLCGLEGARTELDEVALYRSATLNMPELSAKVVREHKMTLFIEYLLSTCLCYVEIFDGSAKQMPKFFATRNRYIAGQVAGLTEEETRKYIGYLKTNYVDIRFDNLKVLKLNSTKKGFKIIQPKFALNLTECVVRITPFFLIEAFVQGIMPTLKKSIVKFTYIKDNKQEREFVSTLSPQILNTYYDLDFVHKMLNGCEARFDRGYIRLPELGCSKYDETGVRALNLTRITSIAILPSIDTSYINVNFKNIVPYFKDTLSHLTDLEMVKLLYERLLNAKVVSGDIVELKSRINAYVDGQVVIGTTTFLRYLHRFMLGLNTIFVGYTGEEESVDKSVEFNLGVAE